MRNILYNLIGWISRPRHLIKIDKHYIVLRPKRDFVTFTCSDNRYATWKQNRFGMWYKTKLYILK